MECERCDKPGEFVIVEAIPGDNPYHTALCYAHLKEFLHIRSDVMRREDICSLSIVRIPTEPLYRT